MAYSFKLHGRSGVYEVFHLVMVFMRVCVNLVFIIKFEILIKTEFRKHTRFYQKLQMQNIRKIDMNVSSDSWIMIG